ncbi:MAG: GntR family transcriptional regulator [Atopobiaceae bacterium]|nr:GntR family transcriptional regulator [Atopobiaceae bacterium]
MPRVQRKKPLYDQLFDLLRDKIDDELNPGDPLPSERSLSERYGLSRTTVRLAMSQLEAEGLIVRQHGRGTFVAESDQEPSNLMDAYSFTEHMKSLGRTPRTEVLEFEHVEATRIIAEQLGIRLGEEAIRMSRLRIADGVPMMFESTCLPAHEFRGLSRSDVEHKPLYDIIEKDYGQHISVADEEFCASIARTQEANALDIAEGAPVLRLFRTTRITSGAVIEYTRSVARADQFHYKVSHRRI